MTDENMQVLMLPRRPIDPEDIIKAGRLMYVTALLMMFVFGGIKLCTVLIM